MALLYEEDRYDSDTVMTAVEGAMATVHRGVCLSAGLKPFAGFLQLESAPADVNRLVREAILKMHETALEATEVQLALSHASPFALVDGEKMREAIAGLVVVLRRSFEHGADVLRIETGSVRLRPDDGSLFRPGSYVHFRFHCVGAGAHPDALGDTIRPPCAGDRTLLHSRCGLARMAGFVRQSSGHFVLGSCTPEKIDLNLYLPQVSRPSPFPANA